MALGDGAGAYGDNLECDACWSDACSSIECCDDDACSAVVEDCDCASGCVGPPTKAGCCEDEHDCCPSLAPECTVECVPCDDVACPVATPQYGCCTTTFVPEPPPQQQQPQRTYHHGRPMYDSFCEMHGIDMDDFTLPGLPRLSSVSNSVIQDGFDSQSCSSMSSITTPMHHHLMEGAMELSEPFHCHWQDCDLSFLNAMQFDQHFVAEHLSVLSTSTGADMMTMSQPLMCNWDNCNIVPQDVPSLLNHVKHEHVEVEEHHRCKWLVADEKGNIAPCNLCVSSVEDLTQHITEDHIGTRQRQYTCHWQDCDRSCRPFAQRQKILRHIVVHTGDKPFRCEICGYTCSEEAVLRQHKRTHTGEKPFVCDVCHKAFSASTALSVHMRTHTGFKPLTCKYPGCGKRFSESSNLAKHMRTHSERKSFACQVPGCGKCFSRPDQLKRHIRCVHPAVESPVESLYPRTFAQHGLSV